MLDTAGDLEDAPLRDHRSITAIPRRSGGVVLGPPLSYSWMGTISHLNVWGPGCRQGLH